MVSGALRAKSTCLIRHSLDKAADAILRFERSTGYKPFKRFHIEHAVVFKRQLSTEKSARTGAPLSKATIDGTLRSVKAFVLWLAGQPGYKSRIAYADAEYFNLNAKDARIAHAERDAPCPTPEQCRHAFDQMPDGTLLQRRDKALFAFLILRQLIDAMMEHMGLTLEQAQPYARNAYNQIRDDLELAGDDVADMDTSQDVVTEIRKMRAEASKKPDEAPTSEVQPETEGGNNGDRPGTDGDAGNEGGQPAGVSPDVGAGPGVARDQGNLRSGEAGSQTGSSGVQPGLQNAGGIRGGTGQDRSGGTRRDGDRPRNYRIPPGGLNDTRGEKTRAKDSVEAIRLLKQIEAQGRRATPAEQQRLALYAGAGSLNPAVPNSDGSVRSGWEGLSADLASLVSKDEMAIRHRHGLVDLRSNGHMILEQLKLDAEAILSQTNEGIRNAIERNKLHLAPVRNQDGNRPAGGLFQPEQGRTGDAVVSEASGRAQERAGDGVSGANAEGLTDAPARGTDGRFATNAAKYSRAILADDGPFTAKKERGIIGQMLTDAIKQAFTDSGLPPFGPHSFRKTLGLLANDHCKTPEQFKAW